MRRILMLGFADTNTESGKTDDLDKDGNINIVGTTSTWPKFQSDSLYRHSLTEPANGHQSQAKQPSTRIGLP